MVQRQCGTHPRAEQEGDIGAASVVRASVLMGNTRPVFSLPLQKTFGASHALRASVLIIGGHLHGMVVLIGATTSWHLDVGCA